MAEQNSKQGISAAQSQPSAQQQSLTPAQLLLKAKLKARLVEGFRAAKSRPTRPTHFMVCVGNRTCMAFVGPRVGSSQKTILRQMMGKDSGLKYHSGRCVFDQGCYTFVGLTIPPGIRVRLERALFLQTNTRYRVKIRKGRAEEIEAQKKEAIDILGGKVIGDLTGVQPDIVRFVKDIAKFYASDITISEGRRDAKQQGERMFKFWTINLKRGAIYKFLAANAAILSELDKLYKKAVEDNSASTKDVGDAKAKFLKICERYAPQLSDHLSGRAIDVSPKSCMTPQMRDAMKTGLQELEETRCYHYSTKSAAPFVTDALKRRWRK